MQRHIKIKGVARILDANINRAKEGLRVCEEISRFILEDQALTGSLKNARHRIDSLVRRLLPKGDILKERESLSDIGKDILGNEMRRAGIEDIYFANIQRVKESIRVLEEFSKLLNGKASKGFKDLRYSVYEIEKSSAKPVSSYK